MFAKLSRFAVLSTAIFSAAAIVRGQEASRPTAPWPFGTSLNFLYSNGSSSNADGASGSQTPSSGQSESNRRLYGPNLAVRQGVADGYATPPGTNAPRFASRPMADDMRPTISQGTPSANGSASDKVTGSGGDGQRMPESTTDGSMPRDSRPLAERLKSMRQSSDNNSYRPMANAGGAATTPDMPSKTGASSRRVVPPSAGINDNLENTPHLAAPSKAAAGDSPNMLGDQPAGGALRKSGKTSDDSATTADASKAGPARNSSRHPVIVEKKSESDGAPSGSIAFTRQSPLVSVETTGPRTIVIGREATYLVTIKNAGEVAAQDVSAVVKIPEWTDVAGSQVTAGTARATAEASEPFQWKIPRLDAHSKEILTLRLLPRKGRAFDLAVQWTFSPIATQTMVDVQEPKLALTLAGPDEVVFGQSKLYRLTISNPGTGDAENVMIKLDPIGNSSAAPSKHPIGMIHAGDSKVVELELTARQSGTVSIHATAMAEPGLKAEAAQEVLVRRAAVALAVEGTKCRYAGTAGSYTIRVSNPGNASAENVRVVATLPTGAKFVAASAGGQWKAEQGKVTWSLPALRPAGEASLDLKCALMSPGANRLQVVSSAAGDVSDAAAITTNIEALADLKLEVTEPTGPIGVGDEVTYELHVRNRGSKAAEGVGVITYFSEGIEPVSAEGGANDISNGVVAFHPVATLAAGAEMSLKVKARADHSGKQVFRAEVECGELGTKLVSAEEMMVYGDDAPGLERTDHAVAGRTSPPQSVPHHAEEGAKPLRR